MKIKGAGTAELPDEEDNVRMTLKGLEVSFQMPEEKQRLSVKMTESEKESRIEQKNSEIVIVQNGGAVRTGDITPIAGMLVLAVFSMAFCVMELLRRIKY